MSTFILRRFHLLLLSTRNCIMLKIINPCDFKTRNIKNNPKQQAQQMLCCPFSAELYKEEISYQDA